MNPTPSPTAVVDSREAAIALVERAMRENLPLIDYGKAHQGVGQPPPKTRLVFEQTGGVIEHYERDLTVRVAAGTTLDQVDAALAETGQFLPIDADGDLTLGEIAMHNVYGPLRLSHGTMRDLLLGMRYIDAEGRDIHVGGRTVKNVAGYDVTKLMVGSLGELGLVYELTLRTAAIPPQVMTVNLRLDSPDLMGPKLTDLLTCEAAPTWLTLAWRDHTWTMDLAYAGTSSATAAQLHSLETFLDALPGVHLGAANTHDFAHDARARRAGSSWRRQATCCMKLIVPPTRTGTACARLAEHLASQTITQTVTHLDALPAHGCIFVGMGGSGDGDSLNSEGAPSAALDAYVRDMLADGSGLRIWHARPNEALDLPPVWPTPDDYPLAAAIKATMDPHGRFNPGRYLTAQPLETTAP